MRYRGYTISNVSDNPSFPWYALYAPDGTEVSQGALPSELKDEVRNIIKSKKMKYINEKKCTLYATHKEDWQNFKMQGHREVSNFEAWAIKKAFHLIMQPKIRKNHWYWTDGCMTMECFKTETEIENYYQLGITENGILVLREYDEHYDQIGQYVVDMNVDA